MNPDFLTFFIGIFWIFMIGLACWDHGRINDLEKKVIDIIKVLNEHR